MPPMPETPEAPTFKFITGALKAFEKDVDGAARKFLSCTASSTIEDLHGDRMTAECVTNMAPQAKAKGMTIFLNHSYKVPEDVFGKTMDARIISRSTDENGAAIYDLDLEVMLNESNPRAANTYAAIKDQGMKLGVSIGAMIKDYAFLDEEAGFWGGLEIKAVDLLEASIVGIPANQRSWVVNGIEALGAPQEMVRKAAGLPERGVEKLKKAVGIINPPTEPTPEPTPEPEPAVAKLVSVDQRFFLNGVDVTEQLDVEATQKEAVTNADGSVTIESTKFKSLIVKDAEGKDITDEDSAAPEEETPDESTEKSGDPADPADDEDPAKALGTASDAVATLKSAGADATLLDIVLGFLEGAAEEVASLRKANEDLAKEVDTARQDLAQSVEIVETIARTPLGRKAQFAGNISTFRTRFAGIYPEEYLKLLDEGEPE